MLFKFEKYFKIIFIVHLYQMNSLSVLIKNYLCLQMIFVLQQQNEIETKKGFFFHFLKVIVHY